MLYAALPVLIFLAVRFVITAWNLLAFPALRPTARAPLRKVSVLIPARNEEGNLGPTLDALLAQDCPLHEIIVLDDHSEDGTAALAESYAARTPLVQLIKGTDLPEGWLGKNWACYQLGHAATGESLLFLDADVHVKPGLIGAALAETDRYGLSLLSIFPDQKLGTLGEKAVVPIMHYILLTMLPLSFVRRFATPTLAAGNGQFMLFSAEDYEEIEPHEAVRTYVTEDIEAVKYVKSKGLRASVHVGGGLVECRMYRGYSEAVSGFGKNLIAGFGGFVGLSIYLYLTVFGYFFVFAALPWPGSLTVLGVIGGMEIMLSRLSARPLAECLLLHPLKMAALIHVGSVSAYRKLTGTNVWKGRRIG